MCSKVCLVAAGATRLQLHGIAPLVPTHVEDADDPQVGNQHVGLWSPNNQENIALQQPLE
jgi:hypothetical protein